MFGCRLKDMASYTSWARLVAASGMIAITYANAEPERDIRAVLEYIRVNGAALGIDENKLAIWACSGNVPLALSVLMSEGGRGDLKCAVLCYGLSLDLDGFTAVADAAKQWGFANPGAGKSVDDLPPEVPLFLVRAGRDQFAGLNDAMDRLVARALGRNLPLTYVNHASGPHAFDMFDHSETSREIIRQILRFMRLHLAGSGD